MSLLPSRGPETSTTQDGELQVVGVDEDVAPLLDALSSETARSVLNAIYEDPGTPSEIADRLDMSIQKVSYHIDKLEEQELIAVAGTRYSEKGQEMTVYEPPEDPLVLFVGTEERKESLLTMVKRLLPVVGSLGIGSLLIDQLYGSGGLLPSFGVTGSGGDSESGGQDLGYDDAGDAGDAGAGGDAVSRATETATDTPAPTATETEGSDVLVAESTATETSAATETPVATETPTPVPDGGATPTPVQDVATEVAETAGSAGATLSPGLAFFLGGLFVLAVVVAWWTYSGRQ
ncbi:ArsR/SmtB family transcription factor [Halomicrobium salinisoli]|uniref:ArsR/SmtB family transcription factor n=1 Tax=Halomicrobium salinisoli TaxID=2878391 RepID=UPI001CF018E4|nr:helix-turn-helix domain-containing protein [Halomicrobium salinisoli]